MEALDPHVSPDQFVNLNGQDDRGGNHHDPTPGVQPDRLDPQDELRWCEVQGADMPSYAISWFAWPVLAAEAVRNACLRWRSPRSPGDPRGPLPVRDRIVDTGDYSRPNAK